MNEPRLLVTSKGPNRRIWCMKLPSDSSNQTQAELVRTHNIFKEHTTWINANFCTFSLKNPALAILIFIIQNDEELFCLSEAISACQKHDYVLLATFYTVLTIKINEWNWTPFVV